MQQALSSPTRAHRPRRFYGRRLSSSVADPPPLVTKWAGGGGGVSPLPAGRLQFWGPQKVPPPTARPLLLQNRAHGHFCLGGTGGDYEAVRFPPARDETGVARRREGGAGVGWTELGGGPNWGDRPYTCEHFQPRKFLQDRIESRKSFFTSSRLEVLGREEVRVAMAGCVGG